MSVEFRVDREDEIVYGVLKGQVTAEEIIEDLERTISDEDYRPHFNGISDLRDINWESEQGDLRKIVQFILRNRGRIGRHRSAIVVSGERSFGMSRMFEVFSEQTPLKVRVFRDYTKALEWVKTGDGEEE